MKQHITKLECISCKEIKVSGEFYKNKANKSGHSGACKECKIIYQQWHRDNKLDKDSNKEYQKKWATKYRKENPEKHREATSRWAKNNRDKVNIMAKRWKQNNPEKIAHIKANRYAREKGAKGSHTLAEWLSVLIGEDYKCVMCGIRGRLTKDHIIPLNKQGTNYIWNIQPLCFSCNASKGDKIL